MNINELAQLEAGNWYLVVTTQLTNLHEYPDFGSQVLEHLVETSQLLVSDVVPVTGYLKVICVGTKREGWVYSNLIKLMKVIPKSAESPFALESSSASIEDKTTPENSWLVHTKQEAFLYEKPEENSTVLGLLSNNSQLFVYSKVTTNGFLNIIDISTNHEGWVQSDLVMFVRTIPKSAESPFAPEGWSANSECTIEVRNDSKAYLTLRMNSNRFHINPKDMKIITLPPDDYTFIASAKSVIPYHGDATLSSGYKYVWKFFIHAVRGGNSNNKYHLPAADEPYESSKKRKAKGKFKRKK